MPCSDRGRMANFLPSLLQPIVWISARLGPESLAPESLGSGPCWSERRIWPSSRNSRIVPRAQSSFSGEPGTRTPSGLNGRLWVRPPGDVPTGMIESLLESPFKALARASAIASATSSPICAATGAKKGRGCIFDVPISCATAAGSLLPTPACSPSAVVPTLSCNAPLWSHGRSCSPDPGASDNCCLTASAIRSA